MSLFLSSQETDHFLLALHFLLVRNNTRPASEEHYFVDSCGSMAHFWTFSLLHGTYKPLQNWNYICTYNLGTSALAHG